MSFERKKPEDRKPLLLSRMVGRAEARHIWDVISRVEIPVQERIDVFTRPKRQLWKLEEELRRQVPNSEERRHIIPRTDPELVRSTDEIAILYGSALTLSHLSHRFTFRSPDEVTYCRGSFNVDIQCIPPRPIKLGSLDEVVQHRPALTELMYVAGVFRKSHPSDWTTMGTTQVRDC